MDENNFNNEQNRTNGTYENTSADYNDGYNDISSQSSVNNTQTPENIYSSSQPQQSTQTGNIPQPQVINSQPVQYSPTEETQPVNIPQTYTTVQQDYSGLHYSNINPQYNPVNPQPPKKSGKGKKVALIAGALALTLCVGIGGGLLGSYLLGNNGGFSISTNASGSENSKTENSNSGLTIIQASDNDVKPTTTQEVAAKTLDSVVEITTESTEYDSFYGQYVSKGAGSGVIISADGYIITNNHVVEGATSVKVRLTNEKSYDAKVIGKDSTLDVALIKIEATDLKPVTFGDSSKLAVGQIAIAIGNPLGKLGGTVTDGIISALDREIELDGKTMTLLQTNAAINPGNSGGGLFDSNGNLIGIVVAKSTSSSNGTSVEGLGFAIPVNNIVDILDDLKTSGYVTGRPALGVTLVDVNTEQKQFMYRVNRLGAYVSSLTSGGAAEKAGIEIGDCITKIGDREVSSSSEIKAELAKLKAGDKIKVTVDRDGTEKTFDVTLGESVSEESSTQENSSYSGNNYDDIFRYYFGNNGGSLG
ncbi:MAG: S1C family serine protease [Acutalibacteraceae bacterium]